MYMYTFVYPTCFNDSIAHMQAKCAL